MLNQRAPPPTYAYRDPSGQNLYITPVHQQRDEMVSRIHLNSASGFIRMFNHCLSYFVTAWFLSPCLQIFLGCYSFHFVRFYSSIILFIVHLIHPFRVVSESKATCKPTQHCWLTTPNIVGCYMLRPFAHPVACCWMLLRVVAQSLKPVKLSAPCKRTQHCWLTTPNIVRSCCARLHVA